MNGDTNEDEKYIAPAIYINIDSDDSLMQEELFGPILPVLTFNEIDEAIQFVNERLVVYIEKQDILKKYPYNCSVMTLYIYQSLLIIIVSLPF